VRRDTRDRLLLPILLPIGILCSLALVLFGFSRILLSLPHRAATATALAVAISVLVVSALAATRTVIRVSSLASMVGAIAGVAMLAGGIALVATAPGKGPAGGGPPTTGGAVANVTAQGLKFDTAEIDLPANTPTTIHFENKDAGVQHNIAIFTDSSLSKVLFRGELVTGPGSTDYKVPPLSPGTYYFHCDVHPMMNGKVVVAEQAGGSPGTASGGAGGASPATITAEGIQFDTNQIDLPANTPVSLTFDNKDAGVQHNMAIYTDSSATTNLFRGQLVTGPSTMTYQIPALPPGTYYFRCDIHPTMNGTVTVG
jgi:plastocyanin